MLVCWKRQTFLVSVTWKQKGLISDVVWFVLEATTKNGEFSFCLLYFYFIFFLKELPFTSQLGPKDASKGQKRDDICAAIFDNCVVTPLASKPTSSCIFFPSCLPSIPIFLSCTLSSLCYALPHSPYNPFFYSTNCIINYWAVCTVHWSFWTSIVFVYPHSIRVCVCVCLCVLSSCATMSTTCTYCL